MSHENPEADLEAKGMWYNPDRVFEIWEFKGSIDSPNVTPAEAQKHVRDYITVGDNEYITDDDLRAMGFEKKIGPINSRIKKTA